MHRKKILFITPTGHKWGSEMFLWFLINDPNFNAKYDFRMITLAKGNLMNNKFNSKISVVPSEKSKSVRLFKTLVRRLTRIDIDKLYIKKIHNSFTPDYWYLNTCTLPQIAEYASALRVDYFVHFHELVSVYDNMKDYALKNMVIKAHGVIGCGQKVYDTIKILGGKKVYKIYEHVDLKSIQINEDYRNSLFEKHNIPKDKTLWVMSGKTSPRKGFDLFVEIAKKLKKSNNYFIWVGKQKDHGFNYYVKQNIASNKLTNVLLVESQNKHYYDYLSLGDFFLLTSREDPFPLVMIEAGYLGMPILAFPSGGASEFIQSDTGYVSDGISVNEIVSKIKDINDSGLQFKKEDCVKEAKKYDTSNLFLQFHELFER